MHINDDVGMYKLINKPMYLVRTITIEHTVLELANYKLRFDDSIRHSLTVLVVQVIGIHCQCSAYVSKISLFILLPSPFFRFCEWSANKVLNLPLIRA